ncbi:hypothetical protein N7G274_007654 [Stereocaulon virgatum]|uniref:Transcription factor TFIIIC triple barrel domain-containing protein n=1 Tax=Stereocaulon virgatum TaxID=373712 RepID=A0ABR4A400_9LECA
MARISSFGTFGAEEDDSEWEYEYHESETESFYVTLDISSASNNLHTKKKRRTTTPPTGDDPRDDLDAAADAAQAPTTPQDEVDSTQLTESGYKATGRSFELEDRIQILDLHSANPIISYQNQIYSCEWTSTVGTDLLLTTTDPDFTHPILREMSGVSVLAATNIKLFARPVHLASRRNVPTQAELQDQMPVLENLSQAEEEPQSTTIIIPPNLAPSRARLDQASFLERLMAAKAARDEKDQVTVFAQRVPQGSGRRKQQKAAAERQTSENAEEDEAEEARPRSTLIRTRQIGRPRTSRPLGKRTARAAKGGLFRDYRPQLWDTAGADIRNDSTRTPESWDRLGCKRKSEQSSMAGATTRSVGGFGLHQPAEGNSNGAVQGASDVDMEDT